MVAMGGGPELPLKGEGSKKSDLLLAVLPWPEDYSKKIIGEIKEEFPDLEFHYIQQKFTTERDDRSKADVPEGRSLCV
jgi:hypothetical protein